jgi:hypothetical protein
MLSAPKGWISGLGGAIRLYIGNSVKNECTGILYFLNNFFSEVDQEENMLIDLKSKSLLIFLVIY